jgi:hypothetical protein
LHLFLRALGAVLAASTASSPAVGLPVQRPLSVVARDVVVIGMDECVSSRRRWLPDLTSRHTSGSCLVMTSLTFSGVSAVHD